MSGRERPRTFHAGPPGTPRVLPMASRNGAVTYPLPQAGTPRAGGEVDAATLARELEGVVDGDVRFDAGHRALYATDASHYRQVPVGVVMPRTKDDVVRTVEACRRHRAPVLGRGGGTSLAGQCCNVAVVLDFSRYMNRVLEVDPERRVARVEPGVVLDDLREAVREHGLTFGPDPATHDRCTLGGMIGNNSCGIHSVMAQWHTGPRTSDNVRRLEVLTYDGARFWAGATDDEAYAAVQAGGGRRAEIYKALRDLRDEHADEIRRRFPDIPRRVSGYNLDDLLPEKGFHVGRALVGSESTCALWLEAEVELIPAPGASTLVVVGYRDVYEAADHTQEVMAHRPIGLEGIDDRLVGYMQRKGMNEEDVRLLPDGTAFLLVQFGGEDKGEADGRARDFCAALGEGGGDRGRGPVDVKLLVEADAEARIWELRESGLGATAYVPGMKTTHPGWEDSAVDPARFGDYLRELRRLMDDYGYDGAFYGHFGQGLLHTRIDFDLEERAGLERYLRFLRDAARLVVRYGGSFSGEHGDGQARGALLSKMYGPRLTAAMRTFKAIWDPDWRMNPGKVIDAYLPDTNLAAGPDWDPSPRDTYFQFPDDGGSFAAATRRCVGVGKCRRHGGGTMCPSYMVTREEEHSTRGRARMLFEMMRGESLEDGWRSDAVNEALDLCLSCKGCKGDCPVDVDMATYKAEFRAHYWAGRLRPRSAYAFGWIHWWARAASKAPRLVNAMSRTEPFARVAKWAAGVHPDRTLPAFATPTFRQRFFREMEPLGTGGRRVILWADTFKDHFDPAPLEAAARVLAALGYRVVVPRTHLCCGRPLYDYGFLGMARKLLCRVVDTLREDVIAGVPVVGVEPSCIATFRDELTNMLPRDPVAARLARQTFLLPEFLQRYATDVDFPHTGWKALLHGHCHQKAVLDFDADRKLLERLGMDVEVPDSGCCGMAGPFGFEREHYDVSQACGERVLLPAVRDREADHLVVTDGYSCREQILQNLDGVEPLNSAQVIWRALREAGLADGLARPRQAFKGPARDRSHSESHGFAAAEASGRGH